MAKQMTDITLDVTEDLTISAGDFSLKENTAQHQQQLILNNNGDFKQSPMLCVGAIDYLDDENFQELMRKISREFIQDGMDVKRVELSPEGIVKTDAYYP
jgi:hypothetical protein